VGRQAGRQAQGAPEYASVRSGIVGDLGQPARQLGATMTSERRLGRAIKATHSTSDQVRSTLWHHSYLHVRSAADSRHWCGFHSFSTSAAVTPWR